MREMLSIDLSEYGDPLHSRMIRIPYTVYRKPWLSGLIGRMGIEDRVNEFFTLPLHEMGLDATAQGRAPPAGQDHRTGPPRGSEHSTAGTRHRALDG
jgi:hypothetical protein